MNFIQIFKNKSIKLFLILGVLIFSMFGIVGCTSSDSINATYIETFFENADVEGQFNIINNHIDLVSLLKNDVPEKYNEEFFENKSLLVFKIVEPSGETKSEISYYDIKDKTLNVYVKSIEQGSTTDMDFGWFILELSKKEVENFDNVKIYKNNKEIISGLAKMYYMDLIDMSSSILFDYEKPNYGLISLNITSSYIYEFNTEQIYKIVSKFNNIPLFHVKDISQSAELDKLNINNIIIEVSYKYINNNNNNDDAIVHFYILENGMLLFEDNRKIGLYYSEINAVNYNEIKTQIIQKGGSMR